MISILTEKRAKHGQRMLLNLFGGRYMDKDSLISMWMASLGEDADNLDKRFIHTITNLIIYAYEKGVENGKKTCGV